MTNKAFEDFEAALKEAKNLTQQMLKLTKRDLEKLAGIERKVNDLQSH